MSAAAGRAREFPWDQAMAWGLGLLRLSPRDFWAMTPRELERAMDPHAGQHEPAPSRSELTRLMTSFPDQGGSLRG